MRHGSTLIICLVSSIVFAAPFPAGVEAAEEVKAVFELQSAASGFEAPVALAVAPAGGERVYVVEEKGRVSMIESGKRVDGQFFLHFETMPDDDITELKLLSMAFHPSFAENRLFYLSYTYREKGTLHFFVSQFQAEDERKAGSDGLAAAKKVIDLVQPYDKHSGGGLAFDGDGYLLIGVGDGGAFHDPKDHGQSLHTLFGKVLRIDPSAEDEEHAYVSPETNPYADNKRGLAPIYAHGFRNPTHIFFDRDGGRTWVTDRGQSVFQEVNLLSAGANYGWSIYEGRQCLRMRFDCLDQEMKMPAGGYSNQTGSAITGGIVYRGELYPALREMYLFGDAVTGTIWGAKLDEGQPARSTELLKTKLKISGFAADAAGRIFVADQGAGAVHLLGAKQEQPQTEPSPAAAPAKEPLKPRSDNPA